MKTALPENAKIAKEAKECMQECVSEFISFITSEGTYSRWCRNGGGCSPAEALTFATASEKCQQEKRKTVNGEDILFAMTSLGFENYGEALKIYLAMYREVSTSPAVALPSNMVTATFLSPILTDSAEPCCSWRASEASRKWQWWHHDYRTLLRSCQSQCLKQPYGHFGR